MFDAANDLISNGAIAMPLDPAIAARSTSPAEPLIRPFMPELDMLRGIAVLGVVLLHGFGDTPQTVASLARALRDRGYDLRLLIDDWCDAREQLTGTRPMLRPETYETLAAQPWPGNVRELHNALDAAALRGGTVIGVEALQLDARDAYAFDFVSTLKLRIFCRRSDGLSQKLLGEHLPTDIVHKNRPKNNPLIHFGMHVQQRQREAVRYQGVLVVRTNVEPWLRGKPNRNVAFNEESVHDRPAS